MLRAKGSANMALWDDFEVRHPELAKSVRMVAHRLPTQEPREALDRHLKGYPSIATRRAASERTAPNGILGVGAWLPSRNAAPVPAVFVLKSIERTSIPANESGYLRSLFSASMPDDLVVIPLAQPRPLSGSISDGTRIKVGMRKGAAGSKATLDGEVGFLTAGHTALQENALVRDSDGNTIGRVTRALVRGTGVGSPSADIAFVRVERGVGSTAPRVSRSIRERDVIAFGDSGRRRQTWIRGLSPEYLLSPTEAGWGHVAITADAVAAPGDSGSAVCGADGALVGHVVAGTQNGYTVIQDAPYQLESLGATAVQ